MSEFLPRAEVLTGLAGVVAGLACLLVVRAARGLSSGGGAGAYGVAAFVALGGGCYCATSWSGHCVPHPYPARPDARPEDAAMVAAAYERRLEGDRAAAVLPLGLSVAGTFVGLTGAVVLGILAVEKYNR